jgi:hypothetical protein
MHIYLHNAFIQDATKELGYWRHKLYHISLSKMTSPLPEAFCHYIYEYTTQCYHVLSILSTFNTFLSISTSTLNEQQMARALHFLTLKCFPSSCAQIKLYLVYLRVQIKGIGKDEYILQFLKWNEIIKSVQRAGWLDVQGASENVLLI